MKKNNLVIKSFKVTFQHCGINPDLTVFVGNHKAAKNLKKQQKHEDN